MPEALPIAPASVRDALARVGMRATPPRLAIGCVLHDASDEPDAVVILCRAQHLEPRTSLGTVYRFLRELEQLGLAASRAMAHGRARWRWLDANDTNAMSPTSPALSAIEQLAAAYGYRLVRRTAPTYP